MGEFSWELPQKMLKPAAPQDAVMENPAQRYVGEITAFYPEKHFGFIKCDEVYARYDIDTYLSEYEIKEFTVGSRISFRIVLNKNGRPQARDLEAADVELVSSETVEYGEALRAYQENAAA